MPDKQIVYYVTGDNANQYIQADDIQKQAIDRFVANVNTWTKEAPALQFDRNGKSYYVMFIGNKEDHKLVIVDEKNKKMRPVYTMPAHSGPTLISERDMHVAIHDTKYKNENIGGKARKTRKVRKSRKSAKKSKKQRKSRKSTKKAKTSRRSRRSKKRN